MKPDRYSRQRRVRGLGDEGQRRLRGSSVLIVGLGALGTHSATALARAGIGRLWLCDRDLVDLGNLQRQVLFTEQDAAEEAPKAVAAARALRTANSEIEIVPYVAHCDRHFLDALPAAPDLVLDGTDNFPTRYLLNDWCRKAKVPWIYAGAVGSEGAAMSVTSRGPCLRCLWPEPPAPQTAGTCETHGVLEPAIAAVAAFQTAEALKILAVSEQSATAGLFTCDVWRGSYQVLGADMQQDRECPCCSGAAYPALAADSAHAAVLCGRNAVQIDPANKGACDLDRLSARLQQAGVEARRTPHFLAFDVEGARARVFASGRSLWFDVEDPLRARALADRWIGLP